MLLVKKKKNTVLTCHGSSCKEIETSHASVFISQLQFAMSINRKIDRREGNVSEETRFGTLSHSEEIVQNSCVNRV